MARWCCCLAVGLCLAAAGTGCTTTQLGESWTLGTPKSHRPASVASRDRKEPLFADDSDEAKESLTVADAGASDKADRLNAMRSPATSPIRSTETRAFIERELSDATPEERAALLSTLRTVPDETVRHILNERRKGLRLVARQSATGSSRSDSEVPPVIQAAGEQGGEAVPSASPARRHSLNGLGTVNAWGHAAPSRKGMPPVETGPSSSDPTAGRKHTAEHPIDPGTTPISKETASSPIEIVSAEATASPERPAEDRPADNRGGTAGSKPAGAGIPTTRTAPTPATPAPPATKGNPILGYLLPGRFGGSAAASSKPAGAVPAAGAQNATVAVGVPREAASGPGNAAIEAGGATPPPTGELLERLIASAEAEAERLPPGDDDESRRAYIEKQVSLRMLYLMAGRQERALLAIPGIDVADQEFWQQTFWGLANYFDTTSMPAPADRAAQTISQLNKAVLRLQEKAHLDLRNVNFCHKIASFGNYEKYPRDEFSSGQEVLLYAEVANIHSELASDGRFRTSLKSTLEIHRHGEQGELVERIELPETIDLCRSYRRDYFHSYQFTIPGKLTLGPHVLTLIVEDQLSRRTTKYSLNFMVK